MSEQNVTILSAMTPGNLSYPIDFRLGLEDGREVILCNCRPHNGGLRGVIEAEEEGTAREFHERNATLYDNGLDRGNLVIED